ncbi:MAG: RNA recognition motif domain-containing protein [Victivallaceae bacterium]
MKLYVGNLSFSTTEAGVKNAFSEFGTVDTVNLITDRDTGRAKGFGFVEMSNANEAQAAIEGLNGKQLDGRAIVVNEARPKEDRPARDGGGFGGNRGGSRGGRW